MNLNSSFPLGMPLLTPVTYLQYKGSAPVPFTLVQTHLAETEKESLI